MIRKKRFKIISRTPKLQTNRSKMQKWQQKPGNNLLIRPRSKLPCSSLSRKRRTSKAMKDCSASTALLSTNTTLFSANWLRIKSSYSKSPLRSKMSRSRSYLLNLNLVLLSRRLRWLSSRSTPKILDRHLAFLVLRSRCRRRTWQMVSWSV